LVEKSMGSLKTIKHQTTRRRQSGRGGGLGGVVHKDTYTLNKRHERSRKKAKSKAWHPSIKSKKGGESQKKRRGGR